MRMFEHVCVCVCFLNSMRPFQLMEVLRTASELMLIELLKPSKNRSFIQSFVIIIISIGIIILLLLLLFGGGVVPLYSILSMFVSIYFICSQR